jgi:hypothetical protein
MPEESLLAPEVAAGMQQLQCLDDAIAFRLARLAQPCADCSPGSPCHDHASDHGLIGDYRRRHGRILAEVLAGVDPAEVARAMREHDGTPPTVLALSLVLAARLRELAAAGPVVTRLDGGPVVFELDGGRLAEHPLPSDPSPGILENP